MCDLTAQWQISNRGFCPVGFSREFSAAGKYVCGAEPHAASWQCVKGNTPCLASIHWLKSEPPPNIWNSQWNLLWLWLHPDKMSRSYMSYLISHQRPVLGDMRYCRAYKKNMRPLWEMWDVLSAHGGSGTGAIFKFGIHVVWVRKLHLITR